MNNLALETYLNTLLQVDQYKDYAPNGLQIQGKDNIKKVIFGVTASLELVEKAIALHADAIVVHHGYFWKGEKPNITGMKQRRIKALLAHDINLFGYHLPLDGHETLGNNAQLGKLWQVKNSAAIAPFDLLWTGEVANLSAQAMGAVIEKTLNRAPMIIEGGNHKIKRLAWCSGSAQGYLEQAAGLGVDAFISGEVSEKTYHEAREYGIHYFAAGHHATERGGIAALCDYLGKHTDLHCTFIDCHNPV